MDHLTATENLLTAIETVAKSVVDKIEYDKTLTCTIVNIDFANDGKYIVTDGSTKFAAYSDNKYFKIGDVVYVTVPNGNMSEQKVILGRKTSDSTEPFNYQSPFDKLLICSEDLIKKENDMVLAKIQANANNESNGYLIYTIPEEICQKYKNFDRIGLKAAFQTILPADKLISGDYGLKADIIYTTSTIEEEVPVLDQSDGYSEYKEYYIKEEEGFREVSVRGANAGEWVNYKNINNNNELVYTFDNDTETYVYRPNLFYYKNYELDNSVTARKDTIYYIYNGSNHYQVVNVCNISDTGLVLYDRDNNIVSSSDLYNYRDNCQCLYKNDGNGNKEEIYLYKPNTFYFIKDKNKEFILSEDNGWNSSNQYYVKIEDDNFNSVLLSKEDYKPFYYYISKVKEQEVTSSMFLNTSDMIGQPYNFTSSMNQEKVFDISNINNIKQINFYLYQDGNFKTLTNEHYDSNGQNNIFLNNLEMYFGYDITNINQEYLHIFTIDSMNYYQKYNSLQDICKKIKLKWIHRVDDENYVIDNDHLNYFDLSAGAEIENDITSAGDDNIVNLLKPEQGQDNAKYILKLDKSETVTPNRIYLTRNINQDSNNNNCSLKFIKNYTEEFNTNREYYEKRYVKKGESENLPNNSLKVSGSFDLVVEPIREEKEAFNSEYDYFIQQIYKDGTILKSISIPDNILENGIFTKTTVDEDGLNVIYKRYYKPNEDGEYEEYYIPKICDNNSDIFNLYYLDIDLIENSNDGNALMSLNTANNINYEPYKYYYLEHAASQKVDIRWYHFREGAPAADEYSGVYWERIKPVNEFVEGQNYISTNNLFELDFYPDPIYNKTEQIKVIALYNDIPVYSNTLEFTNDDAIINLPTIEQENALRMRFEDQTNGKYFMFDENNILIDQGESQKIREITLLFDKTDFSSNSVLNNAESVQWIIPKNNTMINIADINDGILSSDDKFYYLLDTAKRDNYKFRYTISKMYSFSADNNTIVCNVFKDGTLYSSTQTLSFGQNGSNGTEYTLVLNLLSSDQVVTLNKANQAVYYKTFQEYTGQISKKLEEDLYVLEEIEDDKKTYSCYKKINIDDYDGMSSVYTCNNYELTSYLYNEDYVSGEYYYKTKEDEYVLLNSNVPYPVDKVEAVLYDQNYSRVNIPDSASFEWEWIKNYNDVNGRTSNFEEKIQTIFEDFSKEENKSVITLRLKSNNTSQPITILKATLKGFGKYSLVSYLPIPTRLNYGPVQFQGPTQVIYSSYGSPNYYEKGIYLYYNDENGEIKEYPCNNSLGSFSIYQTDQKNNNIVSWNNNGIEYPYNKTIEEKSYGDTINETDIVLSASYNNVSLKDVELYTYDNTNNLTENEVIAGGSSDSEISAGQTINISAIELENKIELPNGRYFYQTSSNDSKIEGYVFDIINNWQQDNNGSYYKATGQYELIEEVPYNRTPYYCIKNDDENFEFIVEENSDKNYITTKVNKVFKIPENDENSIDYYKYSIENPKTLKEIQVLINNNNIKLLEEEISKYKIYTDLPVTNYDFKKYIKRKSEAIYEEYDENKTYSSSIYELDQDVPIHYKINSEITPNYIQESQVNEDFDPWSFVPDKANKNIKQKYAKNLTNNEFVKSEEITSSKNFETTGEVITFVKNNSGEYEVFDENKTYETASIKSSKWDSYSRQYIYTYNEIYYETETVPKKFEFDLDTGYVLPPGKESVLSKYCKIINSNNEEEYIKIPYFLQDYILNEKNIPKDINQLPVIFGSVTGEQDITYQDYKKLFHTIKHGYWGNWWEKQVLYQYFIYVSAKKNEEISVSNEEHFFNGYVSFEKSSYEDYWADDIWDETYVYKSYFKNDQYARANIFTKVYTSNESIPDWSIGRIYGYSFNRPGKNTTTASVSIYQPQVYIKDNNGYLRLINEDEYNNFINQIYNLNNDTIKEFEGAILYYNGYYLQSPFTKVSTRQKEQVYYCLYNEDSKLYDQKFLLNNYINTDSNIDISQVITEKQFVFYAKENKEENANYVSIVDIQQSEQKQYSYQYVLCSQEELEEYKNKEEKPYSLYYFDYDNNIMQSSRILNDNIKKYYKKEFYEDKNYGVYKANTNNALSKEDYYKEDNFIQNYESIDFTGSSTEISKNDVIFTDENTQIEINILDYYEYIPYYSYINIPLREGKITNSIFSIVQEEEKAKYIQNKVNNIYHLTKQFDYIYDEDKYSNIEQIKENSVEKYIFKKISYNNIEQVDENSVEEYIFEQLLSITGTNYKVLYKEDDSNNNDKINFLNLYEADDFDVNKLKAKCYSTAATNTSNSIVEVAGASNSATTKDIFTPQLEYNINNELVFKPSNLYIEDIGMFGIQYTYDGQLLWTQPILYMQNRYFSSTINKWDGSLDIDDENNTILAQSIAAGRKEADNSFSGLIMGDWSKKVNSTESSTNFDISRTTGIYGFNHGATSFGFTDEGQAFIGKSGRGRIYFDGQNSIICSADWYNKGTLSGGTGEGLLLDIDDGFLISRNENGNYIKIDSLARRMSGAANDDSENSSYSNSEYYLPTPIPSSGGSNNEYPFVVYGNKDNFTAIGWQGNLLLHGTHSDDNGDVSGSISINSSAKYLPININKHFGVGWNGALVISGDSNVGAAISQNYGDFGRGKGKNSSDTDRLYPTKIIQVNDYRGYSWGNPRNSDNLYDYSEVNSNFSGLYVNPYGDLYLSRKIIVGDQFSVNNEGYLKASNALFDDCNSNIFTLKYIPTLSSVSMKNKNSWLREYYGDDKYTPTMGQFGYVQGSFDANEDTYNIGLSSFGKFGIKLSSNTNLSISARYSEDSYNPKLSTLTSRVVNFDDVSMPNDIGGIYLESKRTHIEALKEILIQHKNFSNALNENGDRTIRIKSYGDLVGRGKDILLMRKESTADMSISEDNNDVLQQTLEQIAIQKKFISLDLGSKNKTNAKIEIGIVPISDFTPSTSDFIQQQVGTSISGDATVRIHRNNDSLNNSANRIYLETKKNDQIDNYILLGPSANTSSFVNNIAMLKLFSKEEILLSVNKSDSISTSSGNYLRIVNNISNNLNQYITLRSDNTVIGVNVDTNQQSFINANNPEIYNAMSINSSGLVLNFKAIKVITPEPNSQTGIYARFA